ncbi:MAG: protein-disulfide reductase DsbD family protein [Phycisphaerales bacterium]
MATEVITDAATVGPGHPFHVAVVFKCEPGWHVYWKNPGDSGAPPSVSLRLPNGFRATEFEFPCPKVLQEHGETNYVHDGEFALVATVTPPVDAGAAPAKLTLSANWMVCKQLCVMGSREHAVEVATSGAADPRIARFVAALPRPAADFGVTARVEHDVLVISSRAAPAAFIPATTPGVAYGSPTTETRDGAAITRVPLTVTPQNSLGKPLVAAGAVVIDNKAVPAVFTEVSVPVAQAAGH